MKSYESVLKKHFGFDQFRENQLTVIKSVLEDRKDVLVVLFTGAGKSLCYQYPSVYSGKTSLIISPLIALMNDQKMKLDHNKIPCVCLNSTISNKNVIKQEILENKYRLVYTTPEFIEKNEPFIRQLIEFDIIETVVLDEAHTLSSWSNSFRPAYKKLVCIREWGGEHIPFICLTATATKAVQSDIIRELKLNKPLVVKSTFDRPNLIIKVIPKGIQPINDLLSVMKQNEPTIVYCQTKQQCEDLAFILTKNKLISKFYHAGMATSDREAVHNEFAQGTLKCVVCTIAFGMGIDITIRTIINYGIPSDMESYYQQIGRAGRDGLKANCILFFKLADMNSNNYFINQLTNITYRNHMMELSKSMKNYVFSTECRRKYILEYFSETYTKANCGACDNCLNQKDIVLQDFAKEAKAIFDTLSLVDNSFGVTMIVSILRGAKLKTIKPKVKTSILYGSLKDKKEPWLKTLMRLLTNESFIKEYAVSGGNGFTLSNTKKSLDWLKLYNGNQQTTLVLQVPADMQSTKKLLSINTNNLDSPIATNEINQAKLDKTDKLELTYDLFNNQNKTLDEIAKVFDVGVITVEGYIATLYEKDYVLDMTKFDFTDELYATISKKIIELKYPKTMSAIKNALPDDISYFQIKLTIAKMNKLSIQQKMPVKELPKTIPTKNQDKSIPNKDPIKTVLVNEQIENIPVKEQVKKSTIKKTLSFDQMMTNMNNKSRDAIDNDLIKEYELLIGKGK